MYVITGATGNVGSKIADGLLTSGQKVRVIARNTERLKHLSQKGAETQQGSLEDAAFLTFAFEGAKAVFAMIPSDARAKNLAEYMDRIGEAITSALAEGKVPFVVNLSSLGAEHPTGTGPIAGLHRQEERLNQLQQTHLLHLRPTYFMENFLSNIPMIKNMGINGSHVRADLPLPLIATQDIADVSTKSLIKLDFPHRKVRPLLGPKDYTFTEATRILGQAIGLPDLPYVQFSESDTVQGLTSAGFSPDVARSYVEMDRAINNGITNVYQRSPESTTPTKLEEFAPIFAAAYGAA